MNISTVPLPLLGTCAAKTFPLGISYRPALLNTLQRRHWKTGWLFSIFLNKVCHLITKQFLFPCSTFIHVFSAPEKEKIRVLKQCSFALWPLQCTRPLLLIKSSSIQIYKLFALKSSLSSAVSELKDSVPEWCSANAAPVKWTL